MTYQEVKDIITEYGYNPTVKVTITTNANNKKYKQSLRINANGNICIGAYNSIFPNYTITEYVTAKWKTIKVHQRI